MHLYYIRHGEPDYEHNVLTELGREEAETTSIELQKIHFDYIYSSSSNRAVQTASYLANKINKPIIPLDWAKEEKVFEEMGFYDEEVGFYHWIFHSKSMLEKMKTMKDDSNWYDKKIFLPTVKTGIERIKKSTDDWLESLDIQHDFNKNRYFSNKQNDLTIAFFAHGGFGMAFISYILGINYPYFVNHFNEHHTCGVTHIYIDETGKKPTSINLL